MIILKFLEVQILYAALFPSVGWSVGRTGIIFKKRQGQVIAPILLPFILSLCLYNSFFSIDETGGVVFRDLSAVLEKSTANSRYAQGQWSGNIIVHDYRQVPIK